MRFVRLTDPSSDDQTPVNVILNSNSRILSTEQLTSHKQEPNQTKFQIINFRLNIINRLLGYQRYKTQFKFGPKELSFYQYIFLDFKLGIL